ncbi:hypothetical protein MKZ38_003393 [Zalerion maritima]|uniref:Uncharacterized protein n=1 Tax=Zalerion maritima TaxID=339359 RepID=A0AAD5RMQ9_9PEZI|nr:hypothetical protein MKZ38_003393 [Zalerion maritima]
MAEIYNTDRFAELYSAARNAPMGNVGLAARFLIEIFQRNSIPFAFIGGWAIHLRGNTRATEDVDIAVGADMALLKEILMDEPRVCVPLVHGKTCIQVFIHTGGAWDPEFPNTNPLAISADIVINGRKDLSRRASCSLADHADFKGNLNTPPDLPNGTEIIYPASETTQGPGQVPVIDIFYQVTAKLQAHFGRRSSGSTKDYIDLVFLVRTYAHQIQAFCQYLNHDHRIAFVDDVALARPGDAEFISFVKAAFGIY